MDIGIWLDIINIIIKFMNENEVNIFLSVTRRFRKIKNLIIWETNVEMSKIIMLDYCDRFKNITFGTCHKSIYEYALKRYPNLMLNEAISLCFSSSECIIIKIVDKSK